MQLRSVYKEETMDPFFGSLILGGVSALGSIFGSQTQQFTPFAPFVDLQAAVFAGIQQGIEQGGFTFSDQIANELKRQAAFQVDSQFKGAAQKTTAALTPFGNVTAAGRGLSAINTGRALATSQAQNNVDIQQELQKQKSLQGLLALGAGTQDPTLPAFNASNKFPNQQGVFGNALLQGAATGLNAFQAQQPLFGGFGQGLGQGQTGIGLLPTPQLQPNPFDVQKGNINKPLF